MKWVAVAAFYVLLAVAVAQPSPKTADSLWVLGSLAVLLAASLARLLDWIRPQRRSSWLACYRRFMTDEKPPAHRT